MLLCPRSPAGLRLGLAVACLAASTANADQKPNPTTELDAYVKKADKSFAWKLTRTQESAAAKFYFIELTSQTWHGVVWKHDLMVLVPTKARPGATLFLYNTGGKPGLGSTAMALDLATKMQAPVCFLFGIPNQPLFGGKKEDALIAETFVRYLETKDASWPLLFPMTKSLVRAMDALQEFAKQQWKLEVKQFVVAGASKRGWTTWLTAAADPRVKAIVPMVIDTLNMRKQLAYQLKSYGAYSDMIRDYVARDLAPPPETPDGQRLWRMVDPWAYRERYRMPKLILNGTNDPYWTQDALNLYWDDLPGDKWAAYVPNAGHGLSQKGGKGPGGQERAGSVLAAFARAQILDKPLPRMTWKHTDRAGKAGLAVRSDVTPRAVRLWQADAPTRDFRKATWKATEVAFDKGQASAEVAVPGEGCRVFLMEYEFDQDGLSYDFTTQLRVVGKPAARK